MPVNKKFEAGKHILVFLSTLVIFLSGFFLSNYLAEERISQLTTLQENLRIDILSLETQFSILTQAPCKNLNESTLTSELYKISQRLNSVGNTLGVDNPNFLALKKFYSILEIKHWLLLKRAVKECDLDIVSIIYFYSDKENCPKCEDQGYILTYLRKKYPFLRIYSFDYNLPLSALSTLKSIYNLKAELPVIIVNDKVYYGFKNREELENIISEYIELEKLGSATTTEATSTEKTKDSEF
jgi:hypothetical protein